MRTVRAHYDGKNGVIPADAKGVSPGDVVLVRFPFTDLSTSKKRPAVVISPSDFTGLFGDVVVLALTSQPQTDEPARLLRWEPVGLPKPTGVKPVMATLSSSLLLSRIRTIDLQARRVVARGVGFDRGSIPITGSMSRWREGPHL